MDPVVGILSAIIGTAAMTISSETEMVVSGREASDAPGQALSRIVRLAGGRGLEGKPLKVASTWVHWLYGTAWGLVFWLLADPAIGGLPLAAAGAVFFGIVWITAQIVQPALGVAKPIFAYGTKAVATDLFHHGVFAAGTTLAAWLMFQWAGRGFAA